MAEDPLRRFATNVTAGVADPAVAEAFARVPRAHFVRTILDPAGKPVPVTPEKIYSDEALVTRVHDGLPSSSSSQPSLMAQMLEALRLRPGHRVLEVGAGTGYNAALIATVTGAPVVSIDVQEDVVADAQAALARAGVPDVTIMIADGYLGAPAHGPYDRIIATVGIGGVPPSWLDQLTPGGLILAPMEHGGIQPCLAIAGSRAGLIGQGALRSGFMLAAGRLHPRAHRPQPLAMPTPLIGVPIPVLPERRYYELWFGLAARDRRVERRLVERLEDGDDRGTGAPCVVTDPVEGSVVVGLEALYPAAGASPAMVEHVRVMVEEWHALGGPPVDAWHCGFAYADGLWQPTAWHLGSPSVPPHSA